MKKYLTISEFAGLRNVNINSIRYYERKGLLRPAWVDPQTQYRYYLPEQLGILDAITLCIRMGIPLKELKDYVDSDGQLDGKRLFEYGESVMQRELEKMCLGLELIRFNLDNMEQNGRYAGCTEPYSRKIEQRWFLEEPFFGSLDDQRGREQTAIRLFYHARDLGLSPVFPAGVLLRRESGTSRYSIYVQVLRPPEDGEGRLLVPEAVFSCLQADLTMQSSIRELVSEHFPAGKAQTIIFANMPLPKVHYSSRHTELQAVDFMIE